MVAKRDGNGDEGRHRRVRKGGWNIVRKGVEKRKTGDKKSETGKTSEKMGKPSEFGDWSTES